MIKKIKNYALALVTILTLATPALVPAVATAGCSNTANKISEGASGSLNGQAGDQSLCSSGTGVDDNSISTIASKVVNIFSIVVGIAAVIMIIYGGLRYITSGGDSGNVGNAKNTLIYAIVGLVIVALAQIIVHFVLNQTSSIPQ